MTRWCAIAMLAGCGPAVFPPENETTSVEVSSASSTMGGAATSGATSTVGPMDPTTGSDDESTSDYDSWVFFIEPDGGASGDCDLWAQDCPVGEKCMPWANDGGGAWNAARCSPVAPDPGQPGEPCTVVDSGVSGIDDCALGAMCWNVDGETNVGECVAMCKGSEANPVCSEPCTFCYIPPAGVPILCLPICDPLVQDCGDSQGCYPYAGAFGCYFHGSPDVGAAGDPCEYIDGCDPGLACVNPEHVPGCVAGGCCAPYCNVDAPDECAQQVPGTMCTPWFESDEGVDACLPSGTVGFCAVPQ